MIRGDVIIQMAGSPCSGLLPIQMAAAILPVKSHITLIAVEPDKTIVKIEADIIYLPDDCYRDQGNSDKGGQMKKSVQELIKRVL